MLNIPIISRKSSRRHTKCQIELNLQMIYNSPYRYLNIVNIENVTIALPKRIAERLLFPNINLLHYQNNFEDYIDNTDEIQREELE